MNYFLGRLPLLLELLVNGFFVIIYTLQKSKQAPEFLVTLPMELILTHAIWVIPLVLFVSLTANFLKSDGFEDFIRKYVFSLIIFIPMMITWGDLEFIYWLSAVHLFSTLISFYEKKEPSRIVQYNTTSSFLFRLKLAPAQVILLSFGGWILLGALLLVLPVSAVQGKTIAFIDALFMSTSATCVTGLATVSLPDDFSIFGQMIILILAQVGGLGIMTLSSSMAVIMGKNLQMREQIIMQDVLDSSNSEELLTLIVGIIRYTFAIEFIGAVILTLGYYQEGFEIGQSMYYGFYHSIMAFCNAGLALFNNNLEDFKFNPVIHLTVAILLQLGGIGFAVIRDVVNVTRARRSYRELMVHTKIVLVTHSFLIIFGTIYLFFGEFLHAFQEMSIIEKLEVAFFQSSTTRTAGFNTINLNSLHPHSIYMMILLMFIGASPGSTGGGVKTTTFAVLLQSVTATLKGKFNVEFFERKIPAQTVVKAIAIFIISLIVVSGCLLVMMRLEPDKSFLALFFETVSAFGTVGLSLGITPFLSVMGKIAISLLMFVGRVGPLTLVLAVGSRAVLPSKVEYPDGKILIG
ncbi:MAG TPA: TrkH family potassium uptake protein [Bacteriovoracaceae bacterium]|nr:TrkH family potassium uptake protein [Bacteriovoracaceae bacterium]